VSDDGLIVKILDIRKRNSPEEKIKLKSIDLATYNIIGKTSIDACKPFQLMRTSANCSLDWANLEKHSNYLQVTTEENKAYIFDINNEEPALIKRIDNTLEFSDPQTYVEPGFVAKKFKADEEDKESDDYW